MTGDLTRNSDWVDVTAADGHRLKAYRSLPAVAPRGAIIVVQEIFGVNGHIQAVADRFAIAGYAAIAPALFDRYESGVSLGYEGADLERAYSLYQRLDLERAVDDTAAAVQFGTRYGKVGLVGYCYGGLVAWVAASRIDALAASIGYYGGGITERMHLSPRAPTQLHFGTRDAHVPIAPVDELAQRQPAVEIYRYEADHGFNCDVRASYDPESSRVALERTLEFFRRHVG